ncbi:MAG: N-acetyltransferase family protein [Amphiplicatus sp.]
MAQAGSEAEVRRAEAADLPAITAIYNRYVAETPITFDIEPFTVEQRRAWFAQFGAAGRCQLFVAVVGGALAGYAGSTKHKEKRAYDTSVETTIYLDPAHVGRGLGGALYRRLFEALADEDVHAALAGITLPNEASLGLHRRFGFVEIGVFHEVGRKFGRYWDVLWLEKRF